MDKAISTNRLNGIVSGHKSMVAHVLLALFLPGIWFLFWNYRTTKFTNQAPDEKPQSPVWQLILCWLVPIYAIFWYYKQACKVDAMAEEAGIASNISVACVICAIFCPFASMIILQDKINKICAVCDCRPNYSARGRKRVADIFVHIFLVIMCIVWLAPLAWIVIHSFRAESGQFVSTFFPKTYTLDNYIRLFTETGVINFPRMFVNTLIIAIFSCLISTFFVLSVSYCTSRLRFKFRKPYMNIAMILNLFPGFMSMMAVYFILKAFGLTEGGLIPIAMIICFSAGSGTGFYVMKGYMDTIPKALDEAAYLDGATKWQTYTRITLPLCKPMIVYQLITSFMGPWLDFVMAKLIAGANAKYFTVSIGLWNMLEKEYSFQWFTRFAAGAVLVSVPIAALFLYTQKFYQEAMSGSVKG